MATCISATQVLLSTRSFIGTSSRRNVQYPDLLDVGGMGPCKVAVQFRSSVFSKNRGTKPPAKPMAAYKAASAAVARWLAETTFEQPTLADCEGR